MHKHNALFYLVALIQIASSSRVIWPIVPDPEFNTPVMTNGFVGGPTEFKVIGNVTLQFPGCDPYSAEGMLALLPLGPCSSENRYATAVNGMSRSNFGSKLKSIKIPLEDKRTGAAGVIFTDFDQPDVSGRKSRIPLSPYPLEIPAVIIANPEYLRFKDILANSPYLTLEITPGVSLWHQNIAFTWWFIMLNAIFFLFYLFLLGLVIYKFVRKLKATGFIWNISFVYLFFQAAFCILMVVRWIDPILSWGIYSAVVDPFIDNLPATWSFAALILMAFFWFEVINQFADTKVQAFLSKKMQIPFWILVAITILLPAINAILLTYITILTLFIAIGAVSLATGMAAACFYTIVAVKALEIIKRSEQVNVDRKARLDSLRKSRVSIVTSAVIACIYPPTAFILRYYIVYESIIFELAALYVESVLLGVITFIQVWFMPDKSPPSSDQVPTQPRPANEENTTDITTFYQAA